MDETSPYALRWDDSVQELVVDDEGDDILRYCRLIEHGVDPDEITRGVIAPEPQAAAGSAALLRSPCDARYSSLSEVF
jgi:hypothetical protein